MVVPSLQCPDIPDRTLASVASAAPAGHGLYDLYLASVLRVNVQVADVDDSLVELPPIGIDSA